MHFIKKGKNSNLSAEYNKKGFASAQNFDLHMKKFLQPQVFSIPEYRHMED